MAQLNLRPPEHFDFRNPDEWPRWFEQFRVASGSEDASEKQVSALLYCLGEQAESVLSSTDAQRKDYDAVIKKFDDFFKVRKNTIFERARFNQHEGESAEHYIYDLAANCELMSEMIRDRLVVGIRDSGLSERLQLKADLTLEDAKKAVRQREAVQEQQQELKGTETVNKSVNALNSGKQQSRNGASRNSRRNSGTATRNPRKKCTRCGKDAHPRESCPAKDAECYRCKRKGHYGSMCFSKGNAAHTVESDLTSAFLDNLSNTRAGETTWMTTLLLEGKQITFKLDTGAEVTAISSDTHNKLGKPQLTAPDRILYGPSRQPLKVLGHFLATFTHRSKTRQQQVFVIQGLKNNLLGLPAIKTLHLAIRVDAMEMDKAMPNEIKQKFSMLFQGLGNLGEEFTIRLKPNATPYPSQHSTPLTSTSGRGASTHGVHGGDLQGQRTNPLVCRHGCDAKKIGKSSNLCGPKTTEPERTERGSPTSQS